MKDKHDLSTTIVNTNRRIASLKATLLLVIQNTLLLCVHRSSRP